MDGRLLGAPPGARARVPNAATGAAFMLIKKTPPIWRTVDSDVLLDRGGAGPSCTPISKNGEGGHGHVHVEEGWKIAPGRVLDAGARLQALMFMGLE